MGTGLQLLCRAFLLIVLAAAAAVAPAQDPAAWRVRGPFGITSTDSSQPTTATLTLAMGGVPGSYALPAFATHFRGQLFLSRESVPIQLAFQATSATRHEYTGISTTMTVESVDPGTTLVEITYSGPRQPLAILDVKTDMANTSATVTMGEHGMIIAVPAAGAVHVVPANASALRVREPDGFRMVLPIGQKTKTARFAVSATPLTPVEVEQLFATRRTGQPTAPARHEDVADAGQPRE